MFEGFFVIGVNALKSPAGSGYAANFVACDIAKKPIGHILTYLES